MGGARWVLTSQPLTPSPGHLVLEVVLAEVSGLSGAAVPMCQGTLEGREAVGGGPSSRLHPALGGPPSPRLTRLSSRLATMDAKRRSPASSEMRKMYSGADTWLERCVRPGGTARGPLRGGPELGGREGGGCWGWHSPNCWMARSALQGSSSVMCTRRRWLRTRRSACRETPELEASEMMATSCRRGRAAQLPRHPPREPGHRTQEKPAPPGAPPPPSRRS